MIIIIIIIVIIIMVRGGGRERGRRRELRVDAYDLLPSFLLAISFALNISYE